MGLFSDDLSAWYSSVNVQMIKRKLQTFLDNLSSWLSKWRMKLSFKKTVFIIFSPNGESCSTKLSLTYNNKPISYDPSPKFLGVILDARLSFVKYAKYIRERVAPRMNMLRSLKGKYWGMNKHLQLVTYKALIRSLIDYAPQVTICMCPIARKMLKTIQNKHVRSATRWPTDGKNKEMLQAYKIEQVLPRAQRLMDEYLYKALKCNPLIQELVTSYIAFLTSYNCSSA